MDDPVKMVKSNDPTATGAARAAIDATEALMQMSEGLTAILGPHIVANALMSALVAHVERYHLDRTAQMRAFETVIYRWRAGDTINVEIAAAGGPVGRA